jgi:DNA-binding NarL/FixJ family response regulator
VADDLIWSTRLADLVRGSGAIPVTVRSLPDLGRVLAETDAVIVDLTARAYDGVAAVAAASEAHRPVLAVGQHDDLELRRRALAAGAEQVQPYRRLHEDGPRQVARWLAGHDEGAGA